MVQTPLMHVCAAPQTAHDAPHAVRFDAWVEQASLVPSGRMQMNWPAGHGEAGSVQTPATQVWALPQTAQEGPHAFRFEAWSEHASTVPSARVHTNWPAGHGEGGFVQTPLAHVCTAPHTAHDGPHALRLIKWVEQASRAPSARAHWNWPAGQVEGVVQTPLMHVCAAPHTAHDGPHAFRFDE